MRTLRASLTTVLTLGLVLALTPRATADDKPAKPADKPAAAKPADPPAKPADKPAADKPAAKADEKAGGGMDPMMEAMMKAGTPGDAHKKLEPMAGNWKCAMTDLTGPEPQKISGMCSREWILDGRFLAQEFSCEFGGMPFKGMGIMGYDNMKKKYNSVWIDNMSTCAYVELGTYDEATKTWTMTGECDDPMTGKPKKSKSVLKLEGPDKHTFAMYEIGEGGKEKKQFEIIYTREQ
ncbi:hypothetical protein RAS1_06190 [Phycisphaerae bacterium RAS1]|nr:hypothetical protein RAS1_06190 [Phycisphaerae bacterium RAS1]